MQAPEEAVAKYKGQYDAGYEPIRQARYERQKKTGLIKPEWELTEQAGKWDNVENKEWEARCMEVYAAMISELDKGVGQIVETLKKTGQYENTVILFLQDNGACAEEVGRKAEGKYSERPAQAVFPVIPKEAVMKNRRWLEPQTREGYPIVRGKGVLPGPKDTFIAYGKGWANVSNTPFREYKHWVHEGGIATPLIVHSPKYVDASIRGKFERQPGQLPDIMATCIDLAGAAYPKERSGNAVTPAAGTTLVPSFKGQPLNRTLPLVWEHEGNRAIREGKWKLVAKGARGEWELYDVEADRSEQHNLAEKEPDKVKDLAGKWNDWAVKAKVLPSPWTKADDIVADKTPGKKLDFDFSKEQPAADNNTVIKLNDLSGKENVWYVAGKLPVVKQNAGNSAANNGSARYFDGESYIEVSKSSALASAHAAWKAEAEIEADAADGVIIAYGGSRHGYSLFLHGGKPGFAVRLDGEIEIIESEKPISGKTLIQGIITPEKTIELFVNGVKTAGKKISDLLLEEPVESLQIGADTGGSVSGLPLPNFKGKISRITLYREK
jgi:arylsulfatase